MYKRQVFIFMKSVDFNLNNLVQSTTVSDESTSDLTTASYALSGRVGILLAVSYTHLCGKRSRPLFGYQTDRAFLLAWS